MSEADTLIKQIRSLKGVLGIGQYRRELINQLAEIYYQRGVQPLAKTLAKLLGYNYLNIKDYLEDKYKRRRHLPHLPRERIKAKQHSQEELKFFKERSFENLVHFFQEELRSILDGARATDVLVLKERALLRKRGILTYVRGDRRQAEVTERALGILEELKSRIVPKT